MSKKHIVLLYERVGYGSNTPSLVEQTPKSIAAELYELLRMLKHENKSTLLAQSQGGLYALAFTHFYSQFAKRLVILDPFSPKDNKFRKELSKREFKKCGLDKSGGL